jgi:hypothetical protein
MNRIGAEDTENAEKYMAKIENTSSILFALRLLRTDSVCLNGGGLPLTPCRYRPCDSAGASLAPVG